MGISELDKALIDIGCKWYHKDNDVEALNEISKIEKLKRHFYDEYLSMAGELLFTGWELQLGDFYNNGQFGIVISRMTIDRIVTQEIMKKFGGFGDKVIENFEKGKYCGMSYEDAYTRIIADNIKD